MLQDNTKAARRALIAARVAEELGSDGRGAIHPRADRGWFPLSSVQKRLWFTELYHPGTAVNNTRLCLRIEGRLNVPALEQAFAEILRRHECLRARFESVDGQPVQSIAPPGPFRIHRADFSHCAEDSREREALDAALLEAEKPFDLTEGNLFRAALLCLGPEEHLLVVVVHHIVFDGWSVAILYRELGALYNSAHSQLEESPVQYADYAAWQKEWCAGEAVARQLTYWSNRLSGVVTRIELPLERPRPRQQTFHCDRVFLELPHSLVEQLNAVARQQGATLFMTLYAAYRIVLSRHTGQPDLLVGTPVAGRLRSQVDALIGCFVNTLVLRTAVDEDKTFASLLRSARADILEALANQDVPFDRLVEELHPERDLSRPTLVQAEFAFQNSVPDSPRLENLRVTEVPLTKKSTRFELSLEAAPAASGVHCAFVYKSDLFARESVERMAGHFERILKAVCDRPAARLADLDMLTPDERARIVLGWNRTQVPYSDRACVHELIATQARRTPRRVAVEFRDQRLTYAELDERSAKLANHLRRLGVKLESPVGVCIERSCEMLVAVLGVMKAGGTYVPLDPSFPAERLDFMLEDSGAALVLTADDQLWRFRNYSGLVVSMGRSAAAIGAESATVGPSSAQPDNLAYVIYTSGSTGKPKGVMVRHGAVVNLLESMQREPGLARDDVMLAVTTLSFDIAALELYLPLTVGARVVVAERGAVVDGRRLGEELAARNATVMQATPATWRMLIESGWKGDRRLKALCGGEALPRVLAEALLERVGSLWNMYGPTETTIWSAAGRVHAGSGTPAIGRPVANTTIYILDEHGRPTPAGVAGTLYIGGNGLARGYRNLPELTAKKFTTNPLPECGGERIYNTGDLARYRADGQIECLGRSDGQIKMRGYRIELAEIEAALAACEGVRHAAVATRGNDDDKRLVAYLVAAPGAVPPAADIRQHAAKLLPSYMIPSAFVFLDALPLTLNGKVDRNALPAPDGEARQPVTEMAEPQTPTEAKLLRIFEDLLEVSHAGVTDNFFELGGHSLLAARLVTRIEKETGHNIPVATLFQAPTVRQLAMQIDDASYESAWSTLVELRKGDPTAAPLFCIHWLGAKLVTFQKIASMLRDNRPVYGLQPKGVDGRERPLETIQEMATEYVREIRARRPYGPYHLAGSCLGGVVAFEIAQQLTKLGEQVGLLLLIDAFMPGRLEYMHDRPQSIAIPDWYFGEFLLSPAAAVKRWAREVVSRIRGKRREGFSARISDRLRKINFKAVASYRPQPYPGKITLLMCSDGPFRTYEDRRLAWDSVAAAGVEIHVVPGNHLTIYQKPNIEILVEYFQRCLDRFDGIASPFPDAAATPFLPECAVAANQASPDEELLRSGAAG